MTTIQTYTLPDIETLQKRAAGCLLGLGVGDAFGDLGRDPEARQLHGIITNMYAGAKSTDDTEFAVLTGQTLLDCGGKLTHDAIESAWRKYIIGQGGVGDRGGTPLYGAVANLERGMRPPLSGLDNTHNDDDGAAMRIAPVGIVCAGNPQKAADMAKIDAQISHARDGITAAQAVAAGVAVALCGASPEQIVATAQSYIPEDSWLGRTFRRTMTECDEADHIEDVWEYLHTGLRLPFHAMAAEAIPQAFAVFKMTGGDFRRGMFWAGNFGRDADTICAIVGALSGAIHGEDVIPSDWIAKVRQPAGVCLKFASSVDIRDMALQLVDLIDP